MALATTCPQCQTSFKLVPEQLKAHRGLVRCGVCQHVFSGTEHLRYVSEPQIGPVALSSDDPLPDPAPHFDPGSDDEPSVPLDLGSDTQIAEELLPRRRPARLTGGNIPNLSNEAPAITLRVRSMSSDDYPSHAETGRPGGADPDEGAGHTLPLRMASDDDPLATDFLIGDEAAEIDIPFALDPGTADPEFAVARGRVEPTGPHEELPDPGADEPLSPGGFPAASELPFTTIGSRRRPGIMRSPASIALVAALFLLLGVQLALGSRDVLAARMPALRPLLSALAGPFGLQVELPRMPNRVTIESFELDGPRADHSYRLQALLRNRAGHPVQWPAIELALTDTLGSTVTSRVLLPADYLGETSPEGFAGNSERLLSLDLAIDGLAPSGYRAVLFYP